MKNITLFMALFVSFCSIAAPAVAPAPLLEFTGRIYPKDSIPAECGNILKGEVCKKESYGNYHIVSQKDGDLVYNKAIFSDPEGAAVTEETWEKDGYLKKAKLYNRQLGVAGELEIANGKVKYTRTKNGKTETEITNAEPNLVMATTLMAYLRPRFDDILAGKTVQIKMAVIDRMDSFTFNIKKFKEDLSPNGNRVLGLKMSPNSMIIQAVVDAVYFFINASTGELVAFEGRSALRRKVKDKYKDLEVHTSYDPYIHNAFRRSLVATCGSGEVMSKDAACTVGGEVARPSSSSKK